MLVLWSLAFVLIRFFGQCGGRPHCSWCPCLPLLLLFLQDYVLKPLFAILNVSECHHPQPTPMIAVLSTTSPILCVPCRWISLCFDAQSSR